MKGKIPSPVKRSGAPWIDPAAEPVWSPGAGAVSGAPGFVIDGAGGVLTEGKPDGASDGVPGTNASGAGATLGPSSAVGGVALAVGAIAAVGESNGLAAGVAETIVGGDATGADTLALGESSPAAGGRAVGDRAGRGDPVGEGTYGVVGAGGIGRDGIGEFDGGDIRWAGGFAGETVGTAAGGGSGIDFIGGEAVIGGGEAAEGESAVGGGRDLDLEWGALA